MKQDKILSKLKNIVETDLDNLKGNTIFQADGKYHVFDKYTLTKLPDTTFLVSKKNYNDRIFSSMRSALSWCIADKYQQLELARSIQKLDTEKYVMNNDVNTRSGLLKDITDPDRREIIKFKLDHKKSSLKLVENRLTKCVNLAKYWQIQGFNLDETARTKRT